MPSASSSVRGPAARLTTATVTASIVTHVRLPRPTPATSRSGAAWVADEAAAKIAAQEAIVDGFDAVAANDVRNARFGLAMSSMTSSPERIRNAARKCPHPEHHQHRRTGEGEDEPQRVECQQSRRAYGAQSGVCGIHRSDAHPSTT